MKKIVSILLAAGKGTRCGFDEPKQWKRIASIPLFEYSLRAFMNVSLIATHILVVNENDMEKYEHHLVMQNLLTNVVLVAGGQTRQESVYNALTVINDSEPEEQIPALIVIHDTARPMVTCEIIQNTIEAALRTGAAIAAAPVHDTIKKVNSSFVILKTEPRERLYAAQTPQTFSYSTLLKAHNIARETGETVTDDAMLFEHRFIPVTVVENYTENPKITTSADFDYARSWLLRNKPVYMP